MWKATPSRRAPRPFRAPPASRDAGAIVADLLGPAPIALDDLVRASGLPVATVRSVLLDLEVAGAIERHGAGLLSLRPGGGVTP